MLRSDRIVLVVRRLTPLLAALALSRAAGAAESELATGVGVWAVVPDEGTTSPAVSAAASYGLAESLDLQFAVLGSHHEDIEVQWLRIVPGLSVKIDVVEWVPYVGVGPAVAWTLGDGPGLSLGAEAFVGADYLISRSWAVGPEYRLAGYAKPYDGLAHSFGLRLSYRWGW